jgi:uncharacterized RDD family membrane protein YckC
MDRKAQLAYCKKCKHKKFDIQKGIICALTNDVADFSDVCPHYEGEEIEVKIVKSQASKQDLPASASKVKRLINFLVDRIALYILIMIFAFIVASILIGFVGNSIDEIINEISLLSIFFVFLVAMLFYVSLEVTTGKTVGKFYTRTKVVDENGNKPDFRAILIRSLCRFIPFNALSFLGADDCGWHDKFSKTRVVNID